MGAIVAAAVTSHQPGIMMPEKLRTRIYGENDTSLVPGFAEMRDALDERKVDTLVIFDTHWFTTIEHIVAGADEYKGTYTSDELPLLIKGYEYDYKGAPELAAAISECGKARGTSLLNAIDPNIARQYPTINMIHYLAKKTDKILSVGTCQTAEPHNFLEFGEVLAEAVRKTDARVALLAAGGMSHAFPTMDNIPKHAGNSPDQVISPEARAIDERILSLWAQGNHAAVIDMYPEYRPFKPEGFFGHYLMMAGAIGWRNCTAPGRKMSEYESALGTGQVHVWFDILEQDHE